MAWIDDRIWCHPKFSDIPDRAFRVWVAGVAYSTGFATRGILTAGQQKQVGSDARTRKQLVQAELWDDLADGSVCVHDWDAHNSKRDARRVKERDRLRERRKAERETQNGTQYERATERSTDAPATRVDGSDGSEVVQDLQACRENSGNGDNKTLAAAAALADEIGAEHADAGTRQVVLAYTQELAAADFDRVRHGLTRQRHTDRPPRNEAKWVNGALGAIARTRAARA